MFISRSHCPAHSRHSINVPAHNRHSTNVLGKKKERKERRKGQQNQVFWLFHWIVNFLIDLYGQTQMQVQTDTQQACHQCLLNQTARAQTLLCIQQGSATLAQWPLSLPFPLATATSTMSLPQGLTKSESLCFLTEGPFSDFCFSWKSRVSSLHCVPALEIIVIHLTSKSEAWSAHLRLVPPIFSYNQEMGYFLHFLNHPNEPLPHGFLYKLFLKHKDGIRPPPPLQWPLRVPASSDPYQTLVEHIVMTIFFIYTTPFCGGQGWAEGR